MILNGRGRLEATSQYTAQWARHSDKYAIKPPDGYPVVVNENDPVHTKQTWHKLGTMGSDVLEKGERYMLNNTGHALVIQGAGPARGNKKGKKNK